MTQGRAACEACGDMASCSLSASGEQRALLLHLCCGPCATHPVQLLLRDYRLTLFFSNCNISPAEEYEKRLAGAREVARRHELPLVEDAYDHAAWLAHVRGWESAPEGGDRCRRCFEFNLLRAARHAGEHDFDLFTTTLTVSPHKNSAAIFEIGERLGPFLAIDLKKEDGFRKAVALSKQYGLYRQDYCGCEFSRPAGQAKAE